MVLYSWEWEVMASSPAVSMQGEKAVPALANLPPQTPNNDEFPLYFLEDRLNPKESLAARSVAKHGHHRSLKTLGQRGGWLTKLPRVLNILLPA